MDIRYKIIKAQKMQKKLKNREYMKADNQYGGCTNRLLIEWQVRLILSERKKTSKIDSVLVWRTLSVVPYLKETPVFATISNLSKDLGLLFAFYFREINDRNRHEPKKGLGETERGGRDCEREREYKFSFLFKLTLLQSMNEWGGGGEEAPFYNACTRLARRIVYSGRNSQLRRYRQFLNVGGKSYLVWGQSRNGREEPHAMLPPSKRNLGISYWVVIIIFINLSFNYFFSVNFIMYIFINKMYTFKIWNVYFGKTKYGLHIWNINIDTTVDINFMFSISII